MTTITRKSVVQETVAITDTTLYTGAVTIDYAFIAKVLASNSTTTPATLTINIVQSGGSVASTNEYVITETIPAKQSITIYKLIGEQLGPGDFISAIASVASTISLRISMKEISS